MKKFYSLGLVVLLSVLLTACAEQFPQPGLREAGVRTQMSSPVAEFPVPPKHATIYFSMSNPAHSRWANQIKARAIAGLRSEGFNVVNSPRKAKYTAKLSVLRTAWMTLLQANSLLQQGYQGSIVLPGVGVVGEKQVTTYSPADWGQRVYVVIADFVLSYWAPGSSGKHVNVPSKAGKVFYYTRIVSTTVANQYECYSDAQARLSQAIADRVVKVF